MQITTLLSENSRRVSVKKFVKFCPELQKERGFTLIELLIVFSIIVILSSVGLASFSSYSRQQTLQAAAFDVVTMLNVAKSRAFSQVKPSNCTGSEELTLQGYEMAFNTSSGEYDLAVLCGDTTFVLSRKTLPAGISFGNGTSASVTFNVLGSDVSGGGTVFVTGYGTTKTVSISTLGEIVIN